MRLTPLERASGQINNDFVEAGSDGDGHFITEMQLICTKHSTSAETLPR